MAQPIDQLTWIDVTGMQYNLSDATASTYYATGPLPAIGQFGLPVQIVSHTVPLLPGTREQWVQIAANDIKFPLMIFGNSEQALLANIRTLSEAMRPTRGVGILQHTSLDNVTRQLFCREVARFRDVAARGPGWIQVGLEFQAADPYWYDVNWTTLAFGASAGTNFFTSPFLPIHLSIGGVSSSFVITNNGQDIAWPIWTITGPGTNPTITNNTTGQVLTATITLTAGQVLTIDTRPLFINVSREDGSNQWSAISDVSQLWPLSVGPNTISLSMSGTSSASQLQLQYKQVYEGV